MAAFTQHQMKKLQLKRGRKAKIKTKTKAGQTLESYLLSNPPDNNEIWRKMGEEKLVVDSKCTECGYSSKKRNDVIRHIRSVHMKIRDVHCKLCDYKCFGAGSLNHHVKSVHLKIKDFR